MSYFETIVLKSVHLPLKPSYCIEEVCKIYNCSRRTFNRMVSRGELTLSPNKRVYFEEIKQHFQSCRKNDPPSAQS